MKNISRVVTTFGIIIVTAALGLSQRYEKPPQEILDVLNAPSFPVASVSPAKDRIALLEPVSYPTVADMAEPILRLAGLRINPNSNSRANQRYFTGVKLMDIRSGKETAVSLPAAAKLISPRWSADGKYIAVGNIVSDGIELWILDTMTGKAWKLDGLMVNTALGGFEWLPNQRSLMVTAIPPNRGAAPKVSGVPKSPSIQETSGKPAAIRTYQDMLKSPADEALFEYYATSQPMVVNIDGSKKSIGEPGMYRSISASPDANFWLRTRCTDLEQRRQRHHYLCKDSTSGFVAGWRCSSRPQKHRLDPDGKSDFDVGRSPRWRQSKNEGAIP
jgi:dipeptidyl aminopeptidase/acylaminoacyl peptidase